MSWTAIRLKHIARVGYGLGQPPTLSDSGIPILRATNIKRGKFASDGLIFAAKEDLPLDRAPLLRAGEILVVRSGAYTGDSALVTSKWVGSAPGYDLRVTPTSAADPAYVAYCLLSSVTLDQVDLAKARAAQPHLNAEDLGEVSLRLPPLEEQRRITDFLDTETTRIDRLVSIRQRQAESLSDALHSAATRLAGRPQQSGREVFQLRRAVDIVQTGATPSELLQEGSGNDFIPWYTPAAMDGSLGLGKADKAVHATNIQHTPRFPAGSVLIVGIGESLGKVADLDHEATGNQQITAITPSRMMDRRFLAWQLFVAHDEIRNWAQYSRIRILNNDSLKDFPVWLPEKTQQVRARKELDQRLAVLTAFQATATRFAHLASERRQALITAAVTGQIDVTTAGPHLPSPGGAST
ncbi:restriction endonuclease subunit S [Streptomyces mirabilis]|uniref:restriction endonuclease subunit S n=1 Tax=Streptomyces mirabilis TaxID=68239 RepID=UPI0033E1A8C8